MADPTIPPALSAEQTVISTTERIRFPFGSREYVMLNGTQYRVLVATKTTLTVRSVHRWRVVEWLHYHAERAMSWCVKHLAPSIPPSDPHP